MCGSYSNDTADSGDHLACVFAIPCKIKTPGRIPKVRLLRRTAKSRMNERALWTDLLSLADNVELLTLCELDEVDGLGLGVT